MEEPRAARDPSEDDSDAQDARVRSETSYVTAKYRGNAEVVGSVTPGRNSHTAVLSEDRGALFVFGGVFRSHLLDDAFTFDFAHRTWSKVETSESASRPSGRCGHTAIINLGKMYLFAGLADSGPLNDLWQYDFESQVWTELKLAGAPPARSGHIAVMQDNAMYIHGGISSSNAVLADLYRFDFGTLEWTKVESAQSIARTEHAAVALRGHLYIIGGFDGQKERGDMWRCALREGVWEELSRETATPLRPSSGLRAAVMRDKMYITGPFTEIYEYSFEESRWGVTPIIGDPVQPHKQHTMTVRGDSVILFGGAVDPSAPVSRLDYFYFGKDELVGDDMDKGDELSKQPVTEWESIAMRRHPDILEVRERIRGLSGESSYSKIARPSRTEARTALSQEALFQLIMEHLEAQGCTKTVDAIQRETNIPYVRPGATSTKAREANESKPATDKPAGRSGVSIVSPSSKPATETRLGTLMKLASLRLRNYRNLDLLDSDLPKPYEDEFDKEVAVVDQIQGKTKVVDTWDDQPDNRKDIVKVRTQAGAYQVKAGTLNRLLEQLALDPKQPIDLKYIKVFIHTHQSFTTSQIFLKKLIQRYQAPVPKGINEAEYLDNVKPHIAKRVCTVVKYWIEKCPGDFTEKLTAQLNSFIDGPLSRDGHTELVKTLRQALIKSVATKQAGELQFVVDPPDPKVSTRIFSTNMTWYDIDEEEVARQLTLIDFAVYKSIEPTELLNKAWLDSAQKQKSSSVVWLCSRFHDIALWVGTNILKPPKPKHKVKYIERFIRIAKFLRILNNYHTLFAVLEGLQLPAVQYLSRPWSELSLQSQTTFAELLRLVPPKEGDTTAYNEHFHKTVDERSLPALPYMAVVLREILSIEEKHPDTVPPGLINFEKRALLYHYIQFIQEYQRRSYNLQGVYQVRKLLQKSIKTHLHEKDLDELARREE